MFQDTHCLITELPRKGMLCFLGMNENMFVCVSVPLANPDTKMTCGILMSTLRNDLLIF